MGWHVQYPVKYILDLVKNSANFVGIIYSNNNTINI